MRIGPVGNKQVLAAITTYKIISTLGRKQYYTNVTPDHPQYDGEARLILSVNREQTR